MALCYFCNNLAENNCNECNLPVCGIHSVLVEKPAPSGGTETVYCCPNCSR